MSDGINHAIRMTRGHRGDSIGDSPLQPPAPITERLARLEIACERIWPAIRFFGLCGANPEYVAAMSEIGELIGKINPTPAGQPPADLPAIIAAAKREARDEIAAVMESAPAFREGIGRNLAKEKADQIRKLQLSSE